MSIPIPGEDRRQALLILTIFVLLGLSLLRTAWVCDDAYITFRTADNLTHGFGAVWNPAERVQGYTHPLWLGLFTVTYSVTREAYYTSLALGAALTIIAVLVLQRRIADSPWAFAASAVVLLSSKAFIDFSTAGMENALSHLLVLVYLACVWRCRGKEDIAGLTTVASLCVLTRADLALLVGAPLAVAIWRAGVRASWRPALLGLTPILAWEAFSVFYYASFVPNTAFAKLNVTMDLPETLQRGWWYMLRTAGADPVTLPAVLAAAVVTLLADWRRDWPLVAGLAASVAYVCWIGGDFMMGRFFSVPLVWSAALLAHSRWIAAPRPAMVAASVVVLVGLLAPWEPALLSGYGYTRLDNWLHGSADRGPRDNGLLITKWEITDTRRYYFEGNGLLKGRLGDRRPDNPGVDDGVELRAGGPQVVTRYAIGFSGYFAGPDVHIVDVLALTDPLLARLPALPHQRVGHYQRDIPAGYLESLRAHQNLIVDPDLAEYYDRLHYAVSGPLFDWQRCVAAIAFALGLDERPRKRYLHQA